MSGRDEPFGYGANTGLNAKTGASNAQNNSSKNIKDQVNDFQKGAKLNQTDQSKAYQAETERTHKPAMTDNRNDTNNTSQINVLGKNKAGSSPNDTSKPWETKGQDATQTKSDSMHRPAGQQGPGGFKSGSHMVDNMRSTGATNQWESNHVHDEKCGHNTSDKSSNKQWADHVHDDKCGHNVSDKSSSTNQYESKNIGAKNCQNDSSACRMDSGKCSTHSSDKASQMNCQNDSSACRMDSGKCSTHSSNQSGQKSSNYGAGSQSSQDSEQGMVDKAMNWVKQKLGGGNSSNQTNQDINKNNRATADSDKAFNDKKENKSSNKNRH